ncbi:MAG TPA: Gfo/Idh/MocA family oxidoreductase [Thermoanaerobacterales bacterium]|nr:Gfo/Idh/MocA family oxidoreductase [Thermoanaerobacterales bacterium]
MTINLGVIGLGWFSNLNAQTVIERKDFNLKISAACDIKKEKALAFGKKFNVKNIYQNPEDLIKDKDVDIVIIATPPYLHASIGKKALLEGKHVFFEKPGALRPEQIQELIDIAKQNKLKTTIDYVMRRNPLYFIIKRFCDEKIFGTLERAALENYAHDDHMPPHHWFWDYSKSGGIWVEHGVHFFDLVNWLIGPPDKVQAVNVRRKNHDLIDRITGLAIHNDDEIVNYYHGFTKPEPFEKTTFDFIFERAYAKVSGWIPEKLTIDCLVNSDIEAFVKGEVLRDSQNFLPEIDVLFSEKKIELYKGNTFFAAKGKEFHATSRTIFEFTLKQNRWDVYRTSVITAVRDLADAVENKKQAPDVTLYDAKRALEIATGMEQNSIIIS